MIPQLNASNCPRIFAISDLHVDFADNMKWLESLPNADFLDDVLIVAGDLTDALDKLNSALCTLRRKFARVFFVPGNHELWIRSGDFADSIEKFKKIIKLCRIIGVDTEAQRIVSSDAAQGVWVLPMYSWYVKPEERDGSLYKPKHGDDPKLGAWVDNYLVKWPSALAAQLPADYFLGLNEGYFERSFDAPIISFSHFLPRQDLIFSTPEERQQMPHPIVDEVPEFNFTRVAGDARLDDQIRRLGASVHVYGHQHRNRWRNVDGVLYVSNCLGYPKQRSVAGGDESAAELLRIW